MAFTGYNLKYPGHMYLGWNTEDVPEEYGDFFWATVDKDGEEHVIYLRYDGTEDIWGDYSGQFLGTRHKWVEPDNIDWSNQEHKTFYRDEIKAWMPIEKPQRYENVSITEVFNNLRELLGDSFNHIEDVNGYCRKLRSGEIDE